MIDATDSLRRLVEAVYLKTIDREITWVQEDLTDVCEVPLGAGFVQVIQGVDDDGDYYAFIRILNGQRQVVDTIHGGTFGPSDKPFNTGHKNYYEPIRELRASAQRSAVGADEMIVSMLNTLGAPSLNIGKDEAVEGW